MFRIKKSTYIKMLTHFRENQLQYKVLKILYKLLPATVIIFYPVLVVTTAIWNTDKLLKIICIPAIVLIVVTILRKAINRPRPYEKFKTESLFYKQTIGESMPSRHTASAFIIAMTALYINTYIGIVVLGISIIIAISRVLSGVHFISDVITASVISICFGLLFFIL